jgi:hypothetical protein
MDSNFWYRGTKAVDFRSIPRDLLKSFGWGIRRSISL